MRRDFFHGAAQRGAAQNSARAAQRADSARRKIKKTILHHKVYCVFDGTLTEISFEQFHLWLLWSIFNNDNFFLQ